MIGNAVAGRYSLVEIRINLDIFKSLYILNPNTFQNLQLPSFWLLSGWNCRLVICFFFSSTLTSQPPRHTYTYAHTRYIHMLFLLGGEDKASVSSEFSWPKWEPFIRRFAFLTTHTHAETHTATETHTHRFKIKALSRTQSVKLSMLD